MQWIFGKNPFLEAIKAGVLFQKIYITSSVFKDNYFKQSLMQLEDIEFKIVSPKILNKICDYQNHQGIAALIKRESITYWKIEQVIQDYQANYHQNYYICILDELTDPQNFGAIIRNAVFCHCKAIVILKRRSVSITPIVIKISSGAALYIPFVVASNLTTVINQLKKAQFSIYAIENTPEALDLRQVTWDNPVAIIFGNEHKGIRSTISQQCECSVKIPTESILDSLNVASTSGIIFYSIHVLH